MTELRFPNFLIIGAMRSGTTTLYRDLLTHPDVFFPTYKEPGQLASERVLTEAGRAKYAALFAAAKPHDLCGEASTNSTKLPDFPGVPRRAYELMGSQLRLIYLVREPVSRTLSHHCHESSLGYMPCHIKDALETHAELTDYSRYAMQLRAWLDYFDADQIHVIRFEDFIKQRQKNAEECFQFLGLPPTSARVESGRVYNASDEMRILRTGLLNAIQKHPLYHRFVRPLLFLSMKDGLWNILRQKNLSKPPPASLTSVKRIVDAVADDVAELQLLLRQDEPLWDLDAVVARYQEQATIQ